MSARLRVTVGGDAAGARELTGALGEDLLEILQQNGVPIATSCGGVATCGLCRVQVVAGAEHLTPIRREEIAHLGNVAKIVGLRLSCQAKIATSGEVIVDVPTMRDVEERKQRKAERLRNAAHRPHGPPARAPVAERIEWRPRRLPDPKAGGEQGNS